ncbi:MAG: polysaccharide biosynthesis protein, partial [Neobacillus sp.]|nr:polysaccharide biosynthesis protein [Neobacillus sp.]
FIQLADALNLYSLLVTNGYEASLAKSLKGIFDRGQPLIQLGTVVATAMSLSLVPLITSVRLKKDIGFLQDKIKLAIIVSIVIGTGASVGLWAIINPTNIMLFENHLGSSVLGVLSFVILFTSLITPMIAIMQGLGNLFYPALVVVLSFPIKYVLNCLFVPNFDTMGAAYATVITLAIVCLLITIKFIKMVKLPLVSFSILRTVIIAALIMVLFLKSFLYVTDIGLLFLGSDRVIAVVQALGGVFIGGFLYLLFVIRQGVFNERELALFPLGSKLSLLLPKKNRS